MGVKLIVPDAVEARAGAETRLARSGAWHARPERPLGERSVSACTMTAAAPARARDRASAPAPPDDRRSGGESRHGLDPEVHRYIFAEAARSRRTGARRSWRTSPPAGRRSAASGWSSGRETPGFLGWCGLFPWSIRGLIEIGYRYVRRRGARASRARRRARCSTTAFARWRSTRSWPWPIPTTAPRSGCWRRSGCAAAGEA